MVLSHALWQRRFGGRADVLGSSVVMNGRPRRVLGVMPAGFGFPRADTQFWIPTAPSEDQRTSRGSLWLQAIARLEPSTTPAQAQAELEPINAGMQERNPEEKGFGVNVVAYREQVVGPIRPAIRRPARGRRVRAADRLRQRREPAARSRLGARARDGAARGDRRRTRAAGAPARDREPRARVGRRRRRPRAGAARARRVARDGACRSTAPGSDRDRRRRARVRDRRLGSDRSRVRPGARLPHRAGGCRGHAQGRRAHLDASRAARPPRAGGAAKSRSR